MHERLNELEARVLNWRIINWITATVCYVSLTTSDVERQTRSIRWKPSDRQTPSKDNSRLFNLCLQYLWVESRNTKVERKQYIWIV